MDKQIDKRSITREISFQFIFHIQKKSKKNDFISTISDKFIRNSYLDFQELLNENYDIKDFNDSEIIGRVKKTIENYENIITNINQNLTKGSTNNLDSVDLAILTIGICDYLYYNVPKKVVINESVKMAKKFGDKHSFALINAVLDKL